MRRLSAAANAEMLLLRAGRADGVAPEDVVAFAADETTALHSFFEWDDTAAATQYRIEQARLVLRMTIEVVREHNEPIRAFVSLSSDRGTGAGYRRLRDVMNDAAQRAVLLQDALADFRMYRRKYDALEELNRLWMAVDEIEADTKLERREAA